MTRYRTMALAALALLLLLGAPAGAAAQSSANVTGTIVVRGDPLPGTAIVTIQLASAPAAGGATVVIVERTFGTGGFQSPFSFALPYSPEQINPSNRYIIQGNIRVNGQVLYTTSQPYAVITAGNPTSNIQVTMARVGSGLPQASAGTQPLLLSAALLLAGLGAMLLRRRLGRPAA
jgi:uncharacterized lipoprotein YbaY